MTFLHRNIACNYYVAFAMQAENKKTENKWFFHPSLTMCFLFSLPPVRPHASLRKFPQNHLEQCRFITDEGSPSCYVRTCFSRHTPPSNDG